MLIVTDTRQSCFSLLQRRLVLVESHSTPSFCPLAGNHIGHKVVYHLGWGEKLFVVGKSLSALLNSSLRRELTQFLFKLSQSSPFLRVSWF